MLAHPNLLIYHCNDILNIKHIHIFSLHNLSISQIVGNDIFVQQLMVIQK